jgi:hypothetical protein
MDRLHVAHDFLKFTVLQQLKHPPFLLVAPFLAFQRGKASGQASTVHFFIFSNFKITLSWRSSGGVPQRRQQADTGTARRAQMKAGAVREIYLTLF